MNFKKVVVGAATVGVLFSVGLGVKSFAEGALGLREFWIKRDNITTINSSIEILNSHIRTKNTEVIIYRMYSNKRKTI
ncbi:hypothetical protein GFV15_02390 [Lactococcus lactis]|uniref:hypothetical protein n=1 Tax=Lactococcus lactis TaxID=1358 RepID=UPI0012938A35|nr:hypothetical protein [Lactococcus lactis]MQQ79829.1 hypothetical protein [Lactococcus lactis]